MGLDRSFWSDKRVFLTGHTGFKGAWLSLWLAGLNAKVTGYALAPPSEPNLFDAACVRDRLADSYIADVLDLAKLRAALQRAEPDIVLHMAAQSLVRESYADPVATFATNVTGTAHALETVRQTPSVKAVIIVTSDKCYNARGIARPFREDDPLGGHDPYAASKACAELVTACYRGSFFAGGKGPLVASVRAGNIIGGGDWSKDRLIPDLMRAWFAGAPATVRNPSHVRPWQHVFDVLNAYLLLAQHLLSAEGTSYARAWNIGPDSASAKTVADIVALVRTKAAVDIRDAADGGPHENPLLLLDSSAARRKLPWQARLPIEQAVAWTVDWYAHYKTSPQSIANVSRDQLAGFEALLAKS